MFTEKWPYSDFHNLNLDWILETLKKQFDHLCRPVTMGYYTSVS